MAKSSEFAGAIAIATLATLVLVTACASSGPATSPVVSPGSAQGATSSNEPRPTAQPVAFPGDAGVEPLLEGTPGLAELIGGRVAVIDLWATWCEPCRATIPKVIRLHAALADAGLVVAGVHVGEGAEGAARFAAEAGMGYPQFADRRFALSDRLGSRSVPTLLVVDRAGRIVHRGTELDADVLRLVRELLEQP